MQTTRPNKLKCLSLETLSSQVLEFEGEARVNPIGAPTDASFLSKLLVLPANDRLDWKVIAIYEYSSLSGLIISNERKKFNNIDTWKEQLLACQPLPWPTACGTPDRAWSGWRTSTARSSTETDPKITLG